MIRRGQDWEHSASGPPDAECRGDDHALAALALERPGRLVRFVPAAHSDLARVLGLAGPPSGAAEVALDGLRLGDGSLALNAVVLGRSPDRIHALHRSHRLTVVVDGRTVHDGRATGVVVANGQYLRGRNVAPAAHPGDGLLDVQVYALRSRERRAMRRRLRLGTHVPHPGIRAVRGRSVAVQATEDLGVECDGVRRSGKRVLTVVIEPGVLRVVV